MMKQNRFSLLLATVALVGATVLPALAAPPDVDAKGLPAGWEAKPLGTDDTLTDKQSVSVDNGAYTIQAGGNDLWNDNDGGIIVYMKHTGDGSVTAHLLSQVDPEDDGWTKTAVGFRESLEAGSKVVRLSYTSGHFLEPAIRRDADTTPNKPGEGDNAVSGAVGYAGNGADGFNDAVPAAGRAIGKGIWLGMDRRGNKFGYYWSEDGKLWNRIAAASFDLPSEMLAGIEATKHSGDALATSKLDNVNVTNDLLAPRTVGNIEYLPRDKSVLVTWSPISVADGEVTYNVYQIDAKAIDRKKVNPAPIKESSYLVESLTNGTPYRYGVTAVVNGSESPLQIPLPSQGWRGFGMVVPNATLTVGDKTGFMLLTGGTNDVGSVTVTGTGRDTKYAFKVGGHDFWEAADGFSMLAMPMEGDLDVSLRLLAGPTDHGDGWAQGGPCFRESMDPGSRTAIAIISAANSMQFKRRRVDYQRPNNADTSRDDNTARPVSSRIVRKGDTFTAFYSEDDGKTWLPMGGDGNKDTIAGFAKAPYVGMCWTSHEEGTMADVLVDHFEIKPAQ